MSRASMDVHLNAPVMVLAALAWIERDVVKIVESGRLSTPAGRQFHCLLPSPVYQREQA